MQLIKCDDESWDEIDARLAQPVAAAEVVVDFAEFVAAAAAVGVGERLGLLRCQVGNIQVEYFAAPVE